MQIRLLGHVEASVDERPVALGGVKQRAVLAMLGLEANRLVSANRLIEGLWGEQPPPSAPKMVQNYVWRLRKTLGDGGDAEIVTHGRGYELQIDRELIDALRFERLVGEASRGVAGDAARQALALFRGEPLSDIAEEPFAGAEIRRLEELYVTAAELAIDADLAAGRHQEVLGEIERLLADHELRERLHAQRLLALYRSGRQADALAAYQQARATLVEQIGVEPGPELQRLHAAILRHDPALAVESPPLELPEELERAAAAPLIARERELAVLRRLWRDARAGDGAVVAVIGAYGMGKSRVAAELAREVHGQGATVLYAAGGGASEAALATIGRAAEARRSTLLVLDDADRATVDVRLAVHELGAGAHPVLALATGTRAAALARLEPSESLELAPLAEDAVGAIAALYAPPGSEIPSAELLTASRGVPRRVHEAASQWAQRHASDRVDALASRAAAGRSETRALESELAGSVADLRSTRERIHARPAASGVVCPYKGLASFGADDAEYFFGREGLVAELVARLVGARLLAVVGPSGSGKSSVLRAGLLPALAEGVLPGSEHWPQAVMRPGAHPVRELRAAALQPRGVLVVDQFEELFTTCGDERERTEFVAALLAAPRAVVAVRADFYGRCAAYPELSRALAGNHVLVGAMTREELRRAIERPAQRARLVIEPELTEALLADVEGEPGALPLLSTTLLELWGGRDGRRLRLAAYARAGGVHGAVARLAEDAFVALDPGQQAAARTLFLRLGDEDESGTIVRRRIALGEQDAAVVAQLTERRLLTVSDGTVEVAHEALLHEWPRLRRWLDEDREGNRLHRRLREAARAWEGDGREPAGLYRGARLAAARDWAARHDDELEPGERAFLAAGQRASGAAQRRLWAGLAGMASLLVLALIAGALAVHQRNQARTRETVADAQRLGAQALATDDLELSLLLARQAVALRDTPQTRADLFAALLKSPAAIGVIRGVGHPTSLMRVPGGQTLAATTQEGVLRFIDPTRGSVAGPTLGDATDESVVFDPRGARMATNTSSPAIRDARSGTPLVRLQDATYVFDEAFSANGRQLFTLQEATSNMTELRRYDALTGLPIGPPRLLPNGANLPQGPAVLALRRGHRIVTLVSGHVALRDARTLAALWTFDDPAIRHVAVSPDERTLLLGGEDGTLTFVDLPAGTVHRVPGREPRAVVQLAFSPDGHTAASAGADNQILLWDVTRRTVRETLTGHSATVTGLVFGSGGGTLYSSGLDGRILIWDVAGDRRLGRPFTLAPGPAGAALSPDGRTLAVAHADGTVSLVEPATLRSRALRVSDQALGGVAFTDGDHLLATVPRDKRSPAGYGVVIDTRTGRLGPRLAGLGSPRAPSVDAHGRRLALIWHGGAMVQPLAAGRPAGRARFYRRSGGAVSVGLSPDGRTLAVGTHSGIELVDVASMRIRGFLTDSETADTAPLFLRGGRLVAAGSRDGWVRLWSPATSKPASPRLAAHLGPVVALAVSADGRTLATGGTDGSVRLFDLDTGQPLDARLPAAPNSATTPVFSRGGAYLLALSPSGRGYRWDLRPSAWIRRACDVAGRRLTPTEWSQVLPGRAYHPEC